MFNRHDLKRSISVAILAVSAASTVWAAMREPQFGGSVRYLSGGVTDDEREAMLQFRKDYNLTLQFALDDVTFSAAQPSRYVTSAA